MGRLYLRNKLDDIPPGQTDFEMIGPLDSQRYGGLKHTLHNLYFKPKPPAENILSLLHTAIAVCAADKIFLRTTCEDAWTRDIYLSIPVCNHLVGTKEIFEDCVGFLSGDRWSIDFRNEKIAFNTRRFYKDNFVPDNVCLFSGGTDSLTGAINLLEEKKKVLLVGHHDFSVTASTQENIFRELERHFGPNQVRLTQYETKILDAQETTTRTRSLLFIAIGLAVASSFGDDIPLYVPENGFIGINVPLTHGRLGSYSTRTTHPYYFGKLKDIFDKIDIKHSLLNPLKYFSKGEVLENCKNVDLLKKIHPKTISCAHPTTGRWNGLPSGNCGYCFPCLIRRASANHIGIDNKDDYLYDSIGTPEILENGGDKAIHLKSVLLRIYGYIAGTAKPITEVMKSGSLGHNNDDISKYISVFNKGVDELFKFVSDKGCDQIKRYMGF